MFVSRAWRRKRLTGERGQVHQKVTVDDARISRDPITLHDHQHITGDQAAGLDLDLLSVPQYAGRVVCPLTKTLALQRKSPSVVVPVQCLTSSDNTSAASIIHGIGAQK